MKAGVFGWSSIKTLINSLDDVASSQPGGLQRGISLPLVLVDSGVGSIGCTRGTAERPLPPGEFDLFGGATPTGSGTQMDPVEGDAAGKGLEDFPIGMCLASGRPSQWGSVSQSEAVPGRYKEQLAFLFETAGGRDRMRQNVGASISIGGQADVLSNWAKMRVIG